MKALKSKKVMAFIVVLSMIFALNLQVFAGVWVNSYYDTFSDRERSTGVFYSSSGSIYLSHNQSIVRGTSDSLEVWLWSEDNHQGYSYITVSGTKSTTLHWDYVPAGNYKIIFHNLNPVGTTWNVNGSIYDGAI